jgi:hypothetical protein
MSNLQILVSAILVINLKSVSNGRAPPPAVAGDLRTASRRARGHHLLLGMGRHQLRVASLLPRLSYQAHTVAVIVFFLFLLCFLSVVVVLLAADVHHYHRFTSGCTLSPCCSQQRCASIEPLHV